MNYKTNKKMECIKDSICTKKNSRDSFYSLFLLFRHIDEDAFYFLHSMIKHVQMVDDFDT